MNPIEAMEKVVYANDTEWKEQKDELVDIVTQDSQASYEALASWNDERITEYEVRLVTKMSEDIRLARTSLQWSSERYAFDKSIPARRIAESVESSYDVGLNFDDMIFNPFAEMWIGKIVESPQKSYQAMRFWKQSRVMQYGGALLEGVLDTEKDVYTVRDINAEVFFKHGKRLVESVAKKKEDFSGLRGILVNMARVPNFTNNYFDLDEGDRKIWMTMQHHVNMTPFAQLSPTEFSLLTQVYNKSIRLNKSHYFNSSVREVVDKGEVTNWCTHILNHFKTGAIGGDTYERLVI